MALAKVREDKEREAGDGFDGSWVAHPDLVPVCQEVFDRVLGDRPNQLDRLRDDVRGRPPRSCSTSRRARRRSPRPALRGNVVGRPAVPGGVAAAATARSASTT